MSWHKLQLLAASVGLGHSRSIWSVGKPQGSVEVIEELPSPEDFWTRYIQDKGGDFDGYGKPVLMRNAARSMPAFTKWTDEYLLAKYGDTVLDQVETEKKETRTCWDMLRRKKAKCWTKDLLAKERRSQQSAAPFDEQEESSCGMDDDAGSGRSGHMLSCLAGLSGSDAEDIENQLPFGHAQSDGSGDVGDHASESDSDSGDEDPMQHEGSMMEDVRALVEYAMPSELAASPLMGGMSPQAPIGANEGIDSYTSAALAKAAMLMPVSMDLYSVFKEPDTPTHLIGLRRGILAMITLLVLITCTSMHFVLETYTASMRTEVISACSDALTLQNINTDQIMYENITSEKMKQILGTLA
eukprot:symbB.v1.2.005062.t1/scaffold292.1/size239810/6